MSEPKPSKENTVPQEFAEYLEQVCQQIRWKKAHPSIRRELSNHMEDQMGEYLSVGIPPEEAARKTVKEMGDPVQIGTQFDRSYRPKVDKGILLATGLLLVIGYIIQSFFYLQSPVLSLSRWDMPAAVVIGVCGMLAAVKIDYTALAMNRKTSIVVYTIYNAVIFILPLLYRFIAQNSSYYLLFSAAIHLSLLFPLVFCGIVYSFRGWGFPGFLVCGAMATVSLFLMLLNRFTATLITIIPTLAVMVMAVKLDWFGFFSKMKKSAAYVCIFAPVTIFVCTILIRYAGRIFAVIINPSIDARDKGYIYIVIRSVLKSSKWIGRVDLAATPFGDLPLNEILPHDPDLLLTWTIATLGWWTLFIIIPLALLICLKGLHICLRQSGSLGKMVSCAAVFTLAAQFACFIQANLGIVFIVPFPFPFLQGNRSIIVNLILLGFLLSVGQRKGLDEPSSSQEDLFDKKSPVSLSVKRTGQEIDVSLKVRLPDTQKDSGEADSSPINSH